MPRMILPTVALALVLAVPTSAADFRSQFDRFHLWNNCEPVDFLVEALSDNAKSIGLSESRIETTVRSRLRAARIYTKERRTSYVYMNVAVLRQAFTVRIELKKWMKDEASGIEGPTGAWNRGGFGTHGRDASYILSVVGELTDEFIDEYLRVNADSCGKSN